MVQDLIGILTLVFFSTYQNGHVADINTIMISLIKLLLLVFLTITFSQIVFPRLISFISESNEILFITSIAWAFVMVSLTSSELIGFPMEVGAFLAGIALANTSESTQIISKVKSLRDFFVVIFFVVIIFDGIRFDM